MQRYRRWALRVPRSVCHAHRCYFASDVRRTCAETAPEPSAGISRDSGRAPANQTSAFPPATRPPWDRSSVTFSCLQSEFADKWDHIACNGVNMVFVISLYCSCTTTAFFFQSNSLRNPTGVFKLPQIPSTALMIAIGRQGNKTEVLLEVLSHW